MSGDVMTTEQMRARIAELEAHVKDASTLAKQLRAQPAEGLLREAQDKIEGLTSWWRAEKGLKLRARQERDAARAACTAMDTTIQELRARIADLTGETAFRAARVAYHLAHGCDTAEKARELALAEWDVGVMGVRR